LKPVNLSCKFSHCLMSLTTLRWQHKLIIVIHDWEDCKEGD
jgi:hypothetical protein